MVLRTGPRSRSVRPGSEAELTGVPAIVVEPTSSAAGYQLRQLYRTRTGTTAIFPAEVLVQLYRLLGDVRDLMAAVSFLTQILVIAAVLLAVIASLAQRRRQIAVLRALGASRAYVFATVWLGVALILVAGSLLGLALGYPAALILSHIFAARTALALPVTLSGPEYLLIVAIVCRGRRAGDDTGSTRLSAVGFGLPAELTEASAYLDHALHDHRIPQRR